MKTCETSGAGNGVDLIEELNDNNARVMAVQTNVLDQLSGQVQIGRRQDLFWIIIAVIVAVSLSLVSLFGKKKRRRR